jgi:hypothetical protein
LAELAERQWEVFGVDQLQALGISAAAAQRRVGAGRLFRLYRGVYSRVSPSHLSREGHWLAAVLACGPGAVLSHRSAAALHGLRPQGATKIEVTVPTRSARLHDGVIAHRCALHPEDITIVCGIPCTTVARTLVDLAATVRRRPLERACDQAEILQIFDLTAIEDQFARHPRRPGTRRLKAVLDTHYIGQTPTWTDIEERFLALVRAAHLPEPEVNAWIDPDDGEPAIRVDFVWRRERIAVETDGGRTHQTKQAFENDRRRDQRLTAARWRPLRATWRQITRTPRELRITLTRVVAAALAGPAVTPRWAQTAIRPPVCASRRGRLISRWRSCSACASANAARLRKHAISVGARPVSRTSEVICTSWRPQGTIQPNGARSFSTLMAKPCVVTPRATWTPIEAILRSPTQTPV